MEETKNMKSEPADFETAITATGFGKFNLLVILAGIPSCVASAIESATISYILPIAQCDLNLTMEDKGILNAITFIGMLPSAFLWGYLADTIGRKKPLIFAYLLNGFFVVMCGLSQTYFMLLMSKFMTGMMINGSFATLVSYINEFHAAKYRACIPLLHGVVNSISGILLPSVGWWIFTDEVNISVFENTLILKSWNVFFLVCSLPTLVAGLTYLLLPESPKYLMSVGRYDDAIDVFKQIYCVNSGKASEGYPIKILLDETNNKGDLEATESHQIFKKGCNQLMPLFRKPLLKRMILAFTIQLGIMTCLNTLRLWLPEIFTAINDYHSFDQPDRNSNLCRILEVVIPISTNNTLNKTCFVNYNNKSVYINHIIVASVQVLVSITFIFIINKIGKRLLIVIFELCAGFCILLMYFAVNEEFTVLLSSVYLSATGTGSMVMISVMVDMFPTNLRTITLSIAIFLGRCGAMAGNLVFPILLSSGCFLPFFSLGTISIISGILSLFLPKTDLKTLE